MLLIVMAVQFGKGLYYCMGDWIVMKNLSTNCTSYH